MAVNEAREQFDDRITAMETSFLAKLNAGFANIEAMIKGITIDPGGLDDQMSGMDAALTSCHSNLIDFDRRLASIKASLDQLTWIMAAQIVMLLAMLTAAVAANFYH